MNIDQIKKTEDKRQEKNQANKQSMEQIMSLLRQINSLWEKTHPAYYKQLSILMEEFTNLFRTHGFEQKPSKDSSKMSIMAYGDKEISFEILTKRDFIIVDNTKEFCISYGFVLEPVNLKLNRDFNAFINSVTDEVDFYSNRPADYLKEIQSITDYISQLRTAIERVDSWEFEITQLDGVITTQETFKCVTEIIEAIE